MERKVDISNTKNIIDSFRFGLAPGTRPISVFGKLRNSMILVLISGEICWLENADFKKKQNNIGWTNTVHGVTAQEHK